jgi:hypothetical protein
VSDREDFELEALQRQLDDAFETTRPRRGFEDELWLRMQTRRPFWVRLQDGLAGLFRAVREAPAVPATAIAALLVVAIGVGIVRLGSGGGGGGGSTANLAQGGGSVYGPVTQPFRPQTAFGPLPAPSVPRSAGPESVPGRPGDYPGAVNLTWSGQLNVGITSAPVFRYFEPAAATADQLATALGVASVSAAAGDLGTYASPALHLQVRGTIQSPPLEPFFYLVPAETPTAGASAAPADIASSYLATLSLAPAWPYTVATDTAGSVTKVRYLRQFDVPSYGPAYVVNGSGEKYGIEVDVKGGKAVAVNGPLPLGLDSANYPIISGDRAVSMALSSEVGQAGPAVAPTANLNKAELVYVLVVAGDHSFYEPAILFSGTVSVGGHTYMKRVLVSAVDPSQRSG